MSPRVIYTLWTTYINHPLIVQKEILNVFYSAQNFLKKSQWLYIPDKVLINKTTIYETQRLFSKKEGKNKHTCPMFNNKFLVSSKQIKLCIRDYIFPIKRRTYLITIPCVLCAVD